MTARVLRRINRALILGAVGALLGGLLLNHWDQVLRYAILL
jgi:hypothetical protein